MPRDAGVVLVAAGRGLRAGGGTPKQFRPIAGVPLARRALVPFLEHPAIAAVAFVVPAPSAADPPAWLAAAAADPRVRLVAGGPERADSVRLGLAALPAECRLVLVHDGARPFADAALITRVLDAAREGGAAVPGLPVSDTLKRASGSPPVIDATVERAELWQVQTPQGFRRGTLEAAFAAAGRQGNAPTDDATLVERIGTAVRVVAGSPLNMKVTTAEDFELAELIAARVDAAAP